MTAEFPPGVVDITRHSFDIFILDAYLRLRQNCLKEICELTFLQDYPETIIDNQYRVRFIIKHMLDTYADSTRIINEGSTPLERYTFLFREENDIYACDISNNMPFRNDILMICFLAYISSLPDKSQIARSKVISTMLNLMLKKYDISFSSNEARVREITFASISVSYLSITLDIFNNNFANCHEIVQVFPYFNLPIMMYAPMIILVLPQLKDPPIAIYLAIKCVMLKKVHRVNTVNISLSKLFKHTLSLYNEAIPEKVKLRICTRYKIVVSEGDEFKFAPCFTQYRQKAKDVISETMADDPHLIDILSKI